MKKQSNPGPPKGFKRPPPPAAPPKIPKTCGCRDCNKCPHASPRDIEEPEIGDLFGFRNQNYQIINKSGTAVYALKVGTPRNNINESDVIRIKLPGVI